MVGGDNGRRGEDGSPSLVASDGGRRFDELLTALADSRRRYVIYFLRDEEYASRADVARQVAAWEHGCSVDDVPEERVDELEAVLCHKHLPKLREGGIVEYDDRSEMLVFRDPPELVELCLEHCAPRELPA